MRKRIKLILGVISALVLVIVIVVINKKEYRLELVGSNEVVVAVFGKYDEQGAIIYYER